MPNTSKRDVKAYFVASLLLARIAGAGWRIVGDAALSDPFTAKDSIIARGQSPRPWTALDEKIGGEAYDADAERAVFRARIGLV